MNKLNRIKFLLRYMCMSFKNTKSLECILWYINDKNLRKNKHYKLAIDTMFKWANNPCLNVYRYGELIDNKKLQQSENFYKIINILSNYRGFSDGVVPQIFDLANNDILCYEEEFGNIVLKSFEFKNIENLGYFIELCESYYMYIYSESFDKSNIEIVKANYKYMMEKFLSLKDESIAKYYFKVFSNTKLLELEEYTDFVDKVLKIGDKGFEPDEENKLKLLDKLIINCVKDPNIGVFPILETVDETEDFFTLHTLNKIFNNPVLNKLQNLQLISLYISQVKDDCLLDEFEKLLNNKMLTDSPCFNEIMTNAITIRSFRTIQELNKFIKYLGSSQEPLDVVCKFNYEDELLCDVLIEANYITNLLTDVRISLYVKKIEILLLELLSKKDYETVLVSLITLKKEIENNIKENIVITNTLKIIDAVDEIFKKFDVVDEKLKIVDSLGIDQKGYQKSLRNN